jgi:hypothetical protein
MSFGVSTGGFRAGVTLIKELISALRGSAELEYRKLELELHGLQRALDELEHLQPGPGQEIAVNSVKQRRYCADIRSRSSELISNAINYYRSLGIPKSLMQLKGGPGKYNGTYPCQMKCKNYEHISLRMLGA